VSGTELSFPRASSALHAPPLFLPPYSFLLLYSQVKAADFGGKSQRGGDRIGRSVGARLIGGAARVREVRVHGWDAMREHMEAIRGCQRCRRRRPWGPARARGAPCYSPASSGSSGEL
jgi:hypothetical protein